MSVRLKAIKTHIVRNGKLKHKIKKGELFELKACHITICHSDGTNELITAYKVYDGTKNDGWFINKNIKNFVTITLEEWREQQLMKIIK
jgi:hypothetical protein